MELLVIVQAMLAVPLLRCPYWTTVKARRFAHKALVRAVFTYCEKQRAHLPSRNGMKKRPGFKASGVSAFIFPFLFCSFELFIVEVERLDNDVFFLPGRVFFGEVFFEPTALNG